MGTFTHNYWFIYLGMGLLGFFSSSLLVGQEQQQVIPLFGAVSAAELSEDEYPLAAEAPAIWLHDIGHIFWNNSTSDQYIFRTHRRLKVLTEEGRAYARVQIEYDVRESNLVAIQAASYRLNPEGEVVQFRLPKRALKPQKVDRYLRKIEIDFPLVQPGSIIELTYDLSRPMERLLGPWPIQRSLPVAQSIFRFDLPNGLDYQPIIAGAFPNLTQFQQAFQYFPGAPTPQRRNLNNNVLGAQRTLLIEQGLSTVFVIRDVKAIESEAFLSQSELLQSGITLQLIQDNRRGVRQASEFATWEQVYRYGQKRLKPRKLRLHKLEVPKRLKRELRDIPLKEDQIRYVYHYVQETISWDGTYSLWPGNVERVWRRKRGSSAAINMIYIHLLRELGWEAYPVWIGTVDHGIVLTQSPNVSYFNHMIVSIPGRNQNRLADLVGMNAKIEVLPDQDLNQIGLVLGKEDPFWVPLRTQNKLVRFTYGRFTMEPDGQMDGEILIENSAQRAQSDRQKLETWPGTEQNFWREYILAGLSSYELDTTYIIDDEHATFPLRYACSLQTQDFTQEAGELLFLRPMLLKQIEENPFQQVSRSAPVDLSYPLRESYLIGIRLPNGYTIEQVPEPVRVVLPNGGGTFVYNVTSLGNILHISSTIYLDQTLFMPEEYPAIQDFFRYVVQKHQESVVLKKIE